MIRPLTTSVLLNHVARRQISHFITTPIFYVNSAPHLGHLHTLILADALNRHHKLKADDDDECIFSTGTDEHGIKIQIAAQTNNLTCKELCDRNSLLFSNLVKINNTTVSDFIRTTDEKHTNVVRKVWAELDAKGYMYKKQYSGWYSNSDECFVPDIQTTKQVIDGKEVRLDSSGNTLTWSEEDNYMFRLSAVQDDILRWLKEKKPVVPEKFNDDAIQMLEGNLDSDISVSRPVKRLSWAVGVPSDLEQSIYVWLDALCNYLTVAGYDTGSLRRWPIDCQVIGKDILKFHAIYWPAFLSALSLPLPKKLICHSHWLVDSIKMSKSKGNVVDPNKEIDVLSREGMRYYLLRASTTHSDNDYARSTAIARINAELADTYGNLLTRASGFKINPDQIMPSRWSGSIESSQAIELIERLSQLANTCDKHYESADFYKGIDEIMAALRLINVIFTEQQPWSLVKRRDSDEDSKIRHSDVLALTFETLRICSILLQPVIPDLTNTALSKMNVNQRKFSDAIYSLTKNGSPIDDNRLQSSKTEALFQKVKC